MQCKAADHAAQVAGGQQGASMELQGSCHCKAVTFTVRSTSPTPFNRCYCGICRKTAGAGGYAINIGADTAAMEVTGREHLRVYRAQVADPATGGTVASSCERNFCGLCGSPLWVYDPQWPDNIYPHASAIDTDLPVPPHHWHMMLGSKAAWITPDIRDGDRTFDAYPDESLAGWHERLGSCG
jgi:hypothetical protein